MAKDNAQSSFQRGVMSLLILSLLDQEDLYGSPQPTENIQNLAIRARTVHSYATRICDSSQLVKHYFFEKGIDSFLICVILFL